MMSVRIKGSSSIFHRLICFENQPQQLLAARINVLFGQLAILHGLQQLAHGVSARGRHFQCRSVFDAQGVVVGTTPVGDHHPLISPFILEDVLQQMLMLVCIDAVDQVIACHDGPGFALLDRDF